MFSRKIFGIMIILLLAAGIAITTTRCYDDKNEARVTIHLERNDLAAMGIQPQKHFIDRVLEFFSTPAYAVDPPDWLDNHSESGCTVKLYIRSSSYEEQEYSIPYNATEYSVIIPSSNNTTFTLISRYSGQNNWGGKKTLNIGPGEQSITIAMIPMSYFSYLEAGSTLYWTEFLSNPAPSNASSYNIYRANSINGPYTLIKTLSISTVSFTDNTLVPGNNYYYKISISGSDGEGVLSDAYTVFYNP